MTLYPLWYLITSVFGEIKTVLTLWINYYFFSISWYPCSSKMSRVNVDHQGRSSWTRQSLIDTQATLSSVNPSNRGISTTWCMVVRLSSLSLLYECVWKEDIHVAVDCVSPNASLHIYCLQCCQYFYFYSTTTTPHLRGKYCTFTPPDYLKC